jgi:hypothetical protein
MPVNGLLIRSLLNLYQFYGDDFKVECPTGSGKYMTLFEVAKEIARRVSNIFLRDANGKRPVYGGTKKFQDDSHWRDNNLVLRVFPWRQWGRSWCQSSNWMDGTYRAFP